MSRALEVFSNHSKVGVLCFDQAGQFQFQYHRSWLDSGGFWLSPRLSPEILATASANSELHVFLSGLLPEGNALADIAAAAQLKVAKSSIKRVPEPVLLIERFDRQVLEVPRVRRIHMIDACQALGMGVGYKYERNFGSGKDVSHIRDGVSFVKLFSLIEKHVTKKAEAKLHLLRWCLFQYIIGNADAHGKNLSFFVSHSGLSLAPAYDLLCVAAHPQFEQEAAMAIGDNFDFDTLGDYDWALFSHECGIDRRVVATEMKNMAKLVHRSLQKTLPSVYSGDEKAFLTQSVIPLITTRAHRLKDFSQGVTQVSKSMLIGQSGL